MIGSYPNHIDRELHVLHPYEIVTIFAKVKQHALISLYTGTTAKPFYFGGLGIGYFNIELMVIYSHDAVLAIWSTALSRSYPRGLLFSIFNPNNQSSSNSAGQQNQNNGDAGIVFK